jgi:hypothetical protein
MAWLTPKRPLVEQKWPNFQNIDSKPKGWPQVTESYLNDDCIWKHNEGMCRLMLGEFLY